jgi:hypothetical protein
MTGRADYPRVSCDELRQVVAADAERRMAWWLLFGYTNPSSRGGSHACGAVLREFRDAGRVNAPAGFILLVCQTWPVLISSPPL